MKNYFPALALLVAGLALYFTVKWSGACQEARDLRWENTQLMKSLMESHRDVDRVYGQNAGLRSALENLGYEVPEDLHPRSPTGELIAQGAP